MIAVIIPYYQREPGILRNALNSAFASENVDDVCIFIIDDDSPVPAQSEIADLVSTRFPVTIIRQPNSGPGGARNTGLDNLPENVDYVAFLDSDDTWAPQHLQNALQALNAGYDVYFCDHVQLGADQSAFKRAGRIEPTEHPSISGRTDLHAYTGDMFDQIITGNVIGTPTVVFDRRKFGRLRFRTDLTTAGEDYLFWLELSHQGARFAFGSEPAVFCGRGVNVYASSGWGTEGHARRIFHELKYRKAVQSIYMLNNQQASFVRNAINRLEDAFALDLIHRIAHRKHISAALCFSAISISPRIGLAILSLIVKKVLNLRNT